MKCSNNALCVVALCLGAIAAPGFADTGSQDEIRLTLLMTSGTSGKLFDDDGLTVASFAATVREEAERARREGRSVVVIDAGRTVLPYAESRFDGGVAMSRVLESMNCAVFAPAPIDFSIGMTRLAELADAVSFAVIRPFAADQVEAANSLEEFVELEMDGGLILEVRSIMNPSYLEDLSSIGVVDAKPIEAPQEKGPSNRLRLAVIHSRGHGNDLAGRSMTWDLVNSPGDLDVLFDPDLGADAVFRSVSGDHPIVLAGRDQDRNPPWSAARFDINVEADGDRWKVVAADIEIIKVEESAHRDSSLVAELRNARERFKAAQAQAFGDGSPATPEELELFVMSALRERARAEVAILNRGALRPVSPEHFSGGRPTRETVVRQLSFDQYLVVGALTGKQVEALAAESVTRVRSDGSNQMSSLLFGGVTFDISNAGTPAATISNVRVNGRPIRGDDLYSIVTNNFLASGGDEYPVIEAMDGDWLSNDDATLVELRADVVIPRLETATTEFVDLEGKALWHWGADRISLGFNSVTTRRDAAYDDVSDARARADDSTALLTEFRGFLEREQPTWSWDNLLWARYGVLDLEGTERRETDDTIRFQTSAVLTRASILGGGHPYSSIDLVTEFQPGVDSEGLPVPRRFEQSLAAGIDWSAALWPRIRLGLAARNYSHIDKNPQIGLIAEAFFFRKAAGAWPEFDAHFFGEHLVNDSGSISRFDLDLRVLFPLYKDLKLTPALNYYLYRDSELPGISKYFRFSLGLSYSWMGKRQSW